MEGTLKYGYYAQLADGRIIGPMSRTEDGNFFVTTNCIESAKSSTLQTGSWDLSGVYHDRFGRALVKYADLAIAKVMSVDEALEAHEAAADRAARFKLTQWPTAVEAQVPTFDFTPMIATLRALKQAVDLLNENLLLRNTTAVTIKSDTPADLEDEREALREFARTNGLSEPYFPQNIHCESKSPREIETQIRRSENAEGGLSDSEALVPKFAKFAGRGAALVAKSEIAPIEPLPEKIDGNSAYPDSVRNINRDYGKAALHPDFEIRADGKVVRKDRFEVGFRNIVSIMVGPRAEWEVSEIVEMVRELAAARSREIERRAADLSNSEILKYSQPSPAGRVHQGLFIRGFRAGQRYEIERQNAVAENGETLSAYHEPSRHPAAVETVVARYREEEELDQLV